MSPDPPIPAAGLSSVEAARRLARDGGNELPQAPRRTLRRIGGEVAREPMFRLLAAAAGVYLLLGERHEALMLLGFVVVIVAITLVQEWRTERVLEALRDLSSPRALVLRDGEPRRIAGREVVAGDLLLLAEGDRVPADARLLSAHDLLLDESLLTGESLPVAKAAAPDGIDGPPPHPGSEGGGHVFAGTMIVGGQGLARVTATGARSEIGRIGRALGALEPQTAPLHAQTRRMVRLFSALGLALSVAAALLYALTRGDWLGGVLAGITLAMSLLPQEFLLILTVFLAMGAWRLSRQQVLTRRPAAIEALGAATVLCTDKTGTLTHNRMAIDALLVPGPGGPRRWNADGGALPPDFHALLESGLLASEREPFDPMERAFHELGRVQLPEARRHPGWTLVHEYPLSAALPAMTHVWRSEDGRQQAVAIKGAPEAVIALCRLPPDAARVWRDAAGQMAADGRRVLAVARAAFEGGDWPASPRDFGLGFLGLVALVDPLRETVPPAVRECREAGLRVVMITGDHPATALAIAAQAGLDTTGGALTGAELDALDPAALQRRVADATVFARVMPEQKLRIVEALRARGEVVAMTGDGVNDAPSLKAAHIGIAMGRRGTDVAREAAALVLLDDDFGAIVRAMRLGRRIHDNLLKALAFVLAVHVPIAGLTLLPLLLGWPLVFAPVHIAFLELVIDPVCSFAFEAEPEEEDLMRRPPRAPGAPLFSARLIAWSLLQGGCLLLVVAGFFVVLLRAGLPVSEARAAAFVALVAGNFALILANRSFGAALPGVLRRPNAALWAMVAATGALLAAALGFAPLRRLFDFGAPPAATLLAALALGLAVLPVLELLKPLGAHPRRQAAAR